MLGSDVTANQAPAQFREVASYQILGGRGPLSRKCHSLLFPNSNSIVSVLCVASRTAEIQAHRPVCHARCGCPRIPSRTTVANLDCAIATNALLFVVPIIGGGGHWEPPYPPL